MTCRHPRSCRRKSRSIVVPQDLKSWGNFMFSDRRTRMVAMNQRFVTPRDIARILFRHWRKTALFFCAVVGLTLLVVALYPRSYYSEAKLFIRVGRESVGLDPTA